MNCLAFNRSPVIRGQPQGRSPFLPGQPKDGERPHPFHHFLPLISISCRFSQNLLDHYISAWENIGYTIKPEFHHKEKKQKRGQRNADPSKEEMNHVGGNEHYTDYVIANSIEHKGLVFTW